MPSKNPPKKSGRGVREERYLACTRCGESHMMTLGTLEDRPQHRCRALRSPAPFNVDVPRSKAPGTRPQIVL